MSVLEPHERRSAVSLSLLTFAVIVGSSATAGAIQRPAHLRAEQAGATLELHPGASTSALRHARTQVWAGTGSSRALGSAPALGLAGPARVALEAELGADTIASVDADTGLVATLIPAALEVPGASASAVIAEDFAHDFIARHVDALAPGSTPADLVLVSDEVSHGVRTLGFVQHHAGLELVGAQLSLSFKADRLALVRSSALAHVSVPARALDIDPAVLAAEAAAWIDADFIQAGGSSATVEGSPSAPMILALIHDGGAIDYREVVSVEVRLGQPSGRWQPPGRWLVYLDAATGAPVARRSLLHWAELHMNTWSRSPLGPRVDFPAAHLQVSVDGQPSLTDANGLLMLPGPSAGLVFAAEGTYQRVVNAAGPEASAMTTLGQAQTFVWDLGDDPQQDAHISAYVHTQEVKDYIRAIDPAFEPINLQTLITVNISDVCNAYAEDNTINFYLAGGGCENTALIADVIYHEYGHVAHVLGLQPGVGLFDGGVSEGASDYLGATITGVSAVGQGFFEGTDEPIRELDPDGFEWRWPEHTGEVHTEGQIIGGTLWDLRTALIAKHGQALGVSKTDAIWLDGIRRSVDTPSWYLEALLTNDDDGDLQNGTPDICEIDAVFAAHGLYQPRGSSLEVDEQLLGDGSVAVSLDYGSPLALCPGAISPSAVLRHRPRPQGGGVTPVSELAMVEVEPGLLRAVIPPQPTHTVTQYQLELDWGNGTVAPRPQNRADEWYEYFSGPVTEIWCADFESGPAAEGWTLDGEWSFGPPEGGGGDPSAAYDGDAVAGINLAWPGLYSPFGDSTLTSPVIDASGYATVRLQYRRWLNVEDGYWDRAELRANGELAWVNRASEIEELASIHHRDREWRFHDVELTPMLGADGSVQLEFSLASDAGLEFGGWTIDELCVVGHEPPAGGCGDGFVQIYEQCDDGNLENGDGCSSGCLFEDGPAPEPEPVDELDWDPDGRGCGCVASSGGRGGAGGALGVVALLGLLGLRRRRAQDSSSRA